MTSNVLMPRECVRRRIPLLKPLPELSSSSDLPPLRPATALRTKGRDEAFILGKHTDPVVQFDFVPQQRKDAQETRL